MAITKARTTQRVRITTLILLQVRCLVFPLTIYCACYWKKNIHPWPSVKQWVKEKLKSHIWSITLSYCVLWKRKSFLNFFKYFLGLSQPTCTLTTKNSSVFFFLNGIILFFKWISSQPKRSALKYQKGMKVNRVKKFWPVNL